MTAYIEAVFDTNLGNIRTLRFNNPNIGISDSEMRTALQSIISSNVVVGLTGHVTNARRVSLFQIEDTPIPLI